MRKNSKPASQIMIILMAAILAAIFFMSTILGQDTKVEKESEHLHILLINAYHRGYGWTDTQTNGVLDTFMNYSNNVIVSVEYLDWKRYPNKENLQNQLDILSYKYSDKAIDAVIATDDIGMQFSIDHRDQLFPEVPIIFSGVFERSAQKRLKGVSNITGVIEKIDPEGTMEIIIDLHPQLEHIYVVNDHSESGIDVQGSIMEVVEPYAYAYNFTYEILDEHSYGEIVEIMKNPLDHSVIFMGTYNYDYDGKVIPNEIFTKTLSEVSEIPIYTTYEYLFDHGVVGGSLLSGYLQGERAAQMAIEVLNGVSIDSIPVDTVATVYNGFDYDYLAKYDLEKRKLPKNKTIIHKPESAFETYRAVILTTIAIMAMMLGFIAILSINIRNRKKIQVKLNKEHQELHQTYQALSASEEELVAQNKELTYQQKRIEHMAHHDYLTGLPNRLYIKTSSQERIITASLRSEIVMILFVDLDNFNYVNTSFGHAVGDMLLKEVAKRVEHDPMIAGEFARIGGDEFVYLENFDNIQSSEMLAKRLYELLDGNYEVDGNSVTMTVSMGYAIYPNDGTTYDELLNKADVAMYKIKSEGKSGVCRFLPEMNESMVEKIRISHALPIALAKDEFLVYYQPQYSSASETIVGYEALIRWNSLEFGGIGPDRFIPIAEMTGDIIDIGFFVMEEAIKFQNQVIEAKGHWQKIAINISVVQVRQNNFSEEVIDLFEEKGANPNHFELEITESVLINSFDNVKEQLQRLRDYGFSIALDDFGTGYSSLTYLKQLPITTLKIDKSFIDDIEEEGESHFLTASIVDIAHQLGYDVVAEGVEHESQLEYLRNCDCKIIQGYWYSKPKPAAELLDKKS